MGCPRRWSGYLSGAVKSTKILSRFSSKNALTSNSISKNNPTSSAGDFEWLTQHVISPSESKVSIFYCERPKSMWYSGGSRGGARMALVPLLFLDQTEAWRAKKNFFFLRPACLISGCGWPPHPTPPNPLICRSGSTTVAFNFPCPRGGGGCPWSSHFAFPRDRWKAKSILTSNICLTNFSRGHTCTAGSKAVDSSHTETKSRPSGQIKGKGRRVRVCDALNDIKHVRLIGWFLFNNKLCDRPIVICSSDPGKRCNAVKAICYGKICWRIRNSYKIRFKQLND